MPSTISILPLFLKLPVLSRPKAVIPNDERIMLTIQNTADQPLKFMIMKTFITMLLALLVFHSASAETCFPEGITFATQSQINSFRTSNPGCTQIIGDLNISGYNITSLSGLNVITSVGGNLVIECNTLLTNLSGLNNLTSVGGNLYIGGNLKLTNIVGLNHLTQLGGNLTITNNPVLLSLSGLEGISGVQGMLWVDVNPTLLTLTGLDNVMTVSGNVRISQNNSISTLTGLDNLTSIGGSLIIGGDDHLGGLGNTALASLSALSQLNTIGGDLEIGYNSSLASLSGLDNILPGSIINLNIYNNIQLSSCEVGAVCGYLANPNGTIDISGNAEGCSSPAEVEASCALLSAANRDLTGFALFPNPAKNQVTIEKPVNSGACEVRILSTNGRQVMTKMLTGTSMVLDLGGLPAGAYFIRITGNGTVWTEKIVKQ